MNWAKRTILYNIWFMILLLLTLNVSLAQESITSECTPSEYPNAFNINIPEGVNVRSLEPTTLGQTAPISVRNRREIIGWLDATGTPLGSIAGGIWLVLLDENDELRAVKASLVSVADNKATTTREFVYDGSEFLPTEVEITLDENDDITIDSDSELPDCFVVQYAGFVGTMTQVDGEIVIDGGIEVLTKEVRVNQDEIMLPIPLGIVERGQFPDIDVFLDHVGRYKSYGDDVPFPFRQGALYGVLAEVEIAEFNGAKSLLVAFPQDDRSQSWRAISINGSGTFFMMPVDSHMNSMDPPGDFFIYSSDTRISEDGVLTDGGLISVGSPILVTFFDPDDEMLSGRAESLRSACNNLSATPAIQMLMEGGTCEMAYPGLAERPGHIGSDLGGIIYPGK